MENAGHIWRLKLKNNHQKRQTTCQNIQTLHFLYGSFHDYQQTAKLVPLWCLYFIYVEYKTDFRSACPAEPVKMCDEEKE